MRYLIIATIVLSVVFLACCAKQPEAPKCPPNPPEVCEKYKKEQECRCCLIEEKK
jgi:hypothetical protein